MELYKQIDQARRWQGRLLDVVGLGPQETPHRVVHSESGFHLKAYADHQAEGPVLLMVPAPIKRAYIWDLAPGASAVRHCLSNGLRIYLSSGSGQPPSSRRRAWRNMPTGSSSQHSRRWPLRPGSSVSLSPATP